MSIAIGHFLSTTFVTQSAMQKILVAYASKYGATEEIAECIGLVLSQAGHQVSILPVDEVTDVSTYDVFVIGSAVYVGQWRRATVKFLRRHKHELASKQTWLFSSGPTGSGNPVDIMKGWKYPPTLQFLIKSIKPVDIAFFHGHLNPEKLNMIERFLINKIKAPIGDFRDWTSIKQWATDIAGNIEST